VRRLGARLCVPASVLDKAALRVIEHLGLVGAPRWDFEVIN
jgi:hypothetical protein